MNTQKPFAGLPLWDHFVRLTTDNIDNQKMVENHIDYALPLLDRYTYAFPKYTLHNRQHQYNVIKLMGDLLHNELAKITSLESAVLILSAVYHDIGMVYSEDNLARVLEEDDFVAFLNKNSSAKVQFEENGKVASSDLVGWYCRWTHAKRVWVFLNDAEKSIPLIWDRMPIKNELGFVCQSHNESPEFIKSNDLNLSTDFLGECDLTFCALVLRLADILDFDNSRTPKSVYEFLELDKAKLESDKASNFEWKKHLSSNGFTINYSDSQWLFKAAPEDPSTEIGIRRFITLIDEELYACNKLLRFCSSRWNTFRFPEQINVDNIKSNNYRSGNYHFSLAEDSVMNLLTGDGIYSDEYIFLRELLQNALDTSRHREFKESLENPAFKAQAIEVSNFIDTEGYQWVRVDDYGMGMNEEIISMHLLKKGQSYYNSDNFKLEKILIKDKVKTDFVPISRFGIGLLSCFILGDQIEISTLHKNEPGNSFRLSLKGRNGFFTIQAKKDHHLASPMPAKNNTNESGYRNLAGTSIAVRINTNKEFEGFDIKKQVERYLLAPPIQINYEGSPIGGDFEKILIKPWASEETINVEPSFVNEVEEITGLHFDSGIQIKILPINLTEQSLSPKLMGQIVIVYIIAEADSIFGNETTLKLNCVNSHIYLHCTHRNVQDNKRTEKQIKSKVVGMTGHFEIPTQIRSDSHYLNDNNVFQGIRLSHNGIQVSGDQRTFALDSSIILDHQGFGFHDSLNPFLYAGIIYLKDELLPDLTISRNDIKGLSFAIVANVLAAARQLDNIVASNDKYTQFDFFKNIDEETTYTTGVIEKSRFYENNQNFWDNYIAINTDDCLLTVKELKDRLTTKTSFTTNWFGSKFYSHFVHYVLQANFRVSCEFKKENSKYMTTRLLSNQAEKLPDGAKAFTPMTFVIFENSIKSLMINRKINLSHPYVKWYLASFSWLYRDYFYYSRQLIVLLYGSMYRDSPEIDKINRILERLRIMVQPKLAPPVNINLTQEDFEIRADEKL